MGSLFSLLFFVSLLALILGLIKPSVISKLLKKELSRKKIGLLFGILTLAFLILASLTADTSSTIKPSKTENIQVTTNQVKEKTYQQIATLSGNGVKQSEPFNILGERFKVKYDVTGNPCYIQVRPTKQSYKSVTVVNVTKSAKDETIVNKNGEYYIDVITCDSFNLIIEDYK